jgi:hypothetical protein
LIDARWKLGRREDPIEMFNDALRYPNRYGLLAEDVHPKTSEACGNSSDLLDGRLDIGGDALVAESGG